MKETFGEHNVDLLGQLSRTQQLGSEIIPHSLTAHSVIHTNLLTEILVTLFLDLEHYE